LEEEEALSMEIDSHRPIQEEATSSVVEEVVVVVAGVVVVVVVVVVVGSGRTESAYPHG